MPSSGLLLVLWKCLQMPGEMIPRPPAFLYPWCRTAALYKEMTYEKCLVSDQHCEFLAIIPLLCVGRACDCVVAWVLFRVCY